MDRQAIITEIQSLGGSAPPTASDEELLSILSRLRASADIRATNAPQVQPTEPVEQALADVSSELDAAGYLAQREADPYAPDLALPGTPTAEEINELREQQEGETDFDYWNYVFSAENLEQSLDNTVLQTASGATQALDVIGQSAGLYGLITNPLESLTGLDVGSEEALNMALDRREGVQDFFGIDEPEGTTGILSEILGMALPIPGVRAPTGAAANIAEAVTPLTIGATPERLATNVGAGFTIDQLLRELTETEGNEQDTVIDVMELSNPLRALTEPVNPFIIPVLGGLAGASIATPIAASIIRSQRIAPPEIRSVQDVDFRGPENLTTIERAGDVAKAMIADTQDVLLDLAGRAGIPDITSLRRMIDQDTQIAGMTRIAEAMGSGFLRGMHGDFISPVVPKLLNDVYHQFEPALQQNIDTYLKLGDLSDDLRLQIAQGLGPANVSTQLADIARQRAQMRAVEPAVAGFSRDIQRLTSSVRQYLGTGPYAMLSSKEQARLARERKHYVPIDPLRIDPNQPLLSRISDANSQPTGRGEPNPFLQQRDLTKPMSVNNRENAVSTMMEYVQNALQSKLTNDTRNAYIDAMKQSQYGSGTIRRATKEEVTQFPNRIVSVYRNGEQVDFITTKLQSNLLRFDPYVVNNPMSVGLYGLKRGFEQTITGPVGGIFGGFFAPTTMIRDTLAGLALNPIGTAVDPLRVIAAVPEQASMAFRKALADTVQARLAANMPLPLIDPQWQANFADRMSKQYYNSVYHLARAEGGISANLMTSRIRAGHGALEQIAQELAPVINTPFARAATAGLRGWGALFEMISDAPRYAAFKNMVEHGMNPADAASTTRKLTGDTGRSGMSYDLDGNPISGDLVDKQAGALLSAVGWTAEAGRLNIPWFNPAVQGMRKLGNAFATRPVETAMQSWLTVGLPGLAAYGWNQWLSQNNEEGFDYNEYAMEHRSGRDIAMEMYIALPGRRPEEGITIPLPHELSFFMSPWQTALHNMRGSDEEIVDAMTYSGMQILENAAGLAMPVPGSVLFNLMGQTAPQSLLPPWEPTYELSENPGSFLPTNIEAALRSLWGTTAGTTIDMINAGLDGGPEAALDEYANTWGERTPIIKGPLGNKTNVTSFTQLTSQQQAQLAAFNSFLATYDEHFNSASVNRVRSTNLPGGSTGETFEIPIMNVAPTTIPIPTNPLYSMYGEYIRDALNTNSIGMTNAEARYGVLTAQLRLLRGYNAGRKTDFEQYQGWIEAAPERLAEVETSMATAQENVDAIQMEYDALPRGTKTTTPEGLALREQLDLAEDGLTGVTKQYEQAAEALKIRQIIEDNDIDMSNRYDVNRLISILENERYISAEQQLAIIRQVEDHVTDQLSQQGLMPPGQRFRIDRDLGLSAPDYLQSQVPAQLPQGHPSTPSAGVQ